jgi:hypothetical protein
MQNPLSVVWGAAQALDSLVCENPIVRIGKPSTSRERAYDRTLLRFSASGERLIPSAAYDVSSVYAVLFDPAGRVVNRRCHEGGRQLLLGETCTWSHELYDEHLAISASLAYEVETRVDVRRVLLAGKLSSVDIDSEARQPWFIHAVETKPDPLMSASFTLTFCRGYCDVFMAATSAVVHDGHRSEIELVFSDEAGKVLASRWTSLSINSTGVGYNDNSITLEKRVARQIATISVSARTEVRSVTRVGPISTSSLS